MRLPLRHFAGFLALAAIVAGTAASPAAATVWHVPGGVPTLEAALDSAQAGDTVELACGTYVVHDLPVPGNVTVRSADGDPACVTLDATGTGRVFDVAGVTGVRLEGLTLARGHAVSGAAAFDRTGGALRVDASAITLQDCVVRDSRAGFGGGFGARGSSVDLVDCSFAADSARSPTVWAAGGAVWALECTGTVARCMFTGNGAFSASPPGDGGAMFLQESLLVLEDCTFAGNAAGAGAGAVYSYYRDRTVLARCTFTANTSPAGGAMYIENAFPVLDACVFASNTADGGGALFVHARSGPLVRDCTFDGDAATVNAGGAIDCWQSDVTLERVTMRGTSAAGRGGAFAAHGSSGFSWDTCLVDGTSAGTGGGALFLQDTATGTLERCTLMGVSSPGGGAVQVTEASSLSLAACIIAASPIGAAASCGGAGSIAASCSDVFGNAGGDWTGCLAAQAGTAGNFAADPLFCPGADDGGVTLPDSPCLPANNGCGVPVGAGSGGCGCPAGATILVPSDHPTIAAALAAAVPGDVVGICDGTWSGPVDVRPGVHVIGVRADLAVVVPDSGAPGAFVLRAAHVADSTVVAGLTLDGRSLVPSVAVAESASTALFLRRDVIRGGQSWGVVNGADSRLVLGGSLADACDVLDNGGGTGHAVRNDNAAADSLDATRAWWGTQDYAAIVGSVQGKVRTCPITNERHDAELCAPLSAVDVPVASAGPAALAVAPNPARGDVRIAFAAPDGRAARLTIHDVAGRRVRTLAAEAAGGGVARWDGRDGTGRPASPGVYFVRLETSEASITRKLVILR